MEIKLGKPARSCAASGRGFHHGEDIISVARLTEDGLVREDYAREAWTAERGSGAYCSWQSHYLDPQAIADEDKEALSPLRQVFYEALESEDRGDLARAFLAAQLLRRQKVFRLVKEADQQGDEGQILLYTDRLGQRLIEVRDPNFSFVELEAARVALLARLQELENPADAVPDPEAAAEVCHAQPPSD